MKEKICNRCQLSLPKTEEYFYFHFNNKYGKSYPSGYCKECEKEMAIFYYDKHRGKILDYHKEKRKALQNSIGVLN